MNNKSGSLAPSRKQGNVVEEAKPPATADPTNSPGHGKRRRDALEPDTHTAAFQEFLKIMEPPSKKKTWADGTASVRPEPALPTTNTSAPIVESRKNDTESQGLEEFEDIGSPSHTQLDTLKAPEPVDMGDASGSHSENENQEDESNESKETLDSLRSPSKRAGITVDINRPASSTDDTWLRSHTNRVLDLIDESDAVDAKPKLSSSFSVSGGIEAHDSSRAFEPDLGTSMRQPSETPDSAENAYDLPTSTEGVHQSASGRLFIRNLPYSATESELRDHVESGNFGTIEEVGRSALAFHAFPIHFVMNILIGTTDVSYLM